MAKEIVMPPLSQTTDQVKLLEWLVGEGDEVNKGDPLCEVETDKVTMEVESFTAGTVLKIVAQPQEDVTVGNIIAYVGTPGEEVPDIPAGQGEAKGKSETPAGDVSPLARKIAENEGIELSRIQGTGPAGRVLKKDVEQHMAGDGVNQPPPAGKKATLIVRNLAKKSGIDLGQVQGTGPGGLITRDDLAAFSEPKAVAVTGASTEIQGELTDNQRAVGELLTMSKTHIPHFYLKATVVMDRLTTYREAMKNPDGSKLSVTAILTYCLGRALARHRRLNGYFAEGKLIHRDEINIAIAVASGDDLYVPVVRNADKKNISEIHLELAALTAKVKGGTLVREDVRGATFTISNLGMFPVDEFVAIISPKQSGILAVGKSEKRLFIDKNNAMNIKTAAILTGSFDHRIAGGATAAEFMGTIKTIIEDEIGY
jgi:pyruvate dehydrogenase E2 component (dihydrolipoamide acetyltransferase)